MPDEFEFFTNKHPGRTYISGAFDSWDDGQRMRFVSKVFDSAEQHCFAKLKRETVIRVTHGGRYEVKALFYEDSRDIKSVCIQRFTVESGNPHRQSFTFFGNEVARIYDLLRAVKYFDLNEQEKQRLDDQILDDLLVSAGEKKRFLLQNEDLIVDILNNDLTKADIVALAYRKQQLEQFDKLLHDPSYFAKTQEQRPKGGKEAVWQGFFERNPWIFGYGLNYIFATNLDNRKLEQVTSGYAVNRAGKRADALMRTRGLISSLCFVEIKTHETPLLESRSYRSESWAISAELAGSIAQTQKTVQKAMEDIRNKLEIHSDAGDPTGEIAYLYQPRSFVLIGSLGEFRTQQGINEQKFGSFEVFRKNLVNPEVITFDEMFERARFIVRNSEDEMAELGSSTARSTVDYDDDMPSVEDDIPF